MLAPVMLLTLSGCPVDVSELTHQHAPSVDEALARGRTAGTEDPAGDAHHNPTGTTTPELPSPRFASPAEVFAGLAGYLQPEAPHPEPERPPDTPVPPALEPPATAPDSAPAPAAVPGGTAGVAQPFQPPPSKPQNSPLGPDGRPTHPEHPRP